jgi:hypothetical protein
MLQRRPFKQSSAHEDRLEEEADNLRRQAEGMPPCIRREELLRKARQAETAAQISASFRSPGFSRQSHNGVRDDNDLQARSEQALVVVTLSMATVIACVALLVSTL